MKIKNGMKTMFNKLKNMWSKGIIQRTTRVTYGVMWNVVLFFIVLGLFGFLFVGGVGAGYFASLVDDEEIRDYESMENDIYNYEETTRMYFANNVYFGEVRSDLYRDEVSLDDISPHLVAAVIATEDEHFNEHQGVVPKAILRAVLQEVTNADTQTGGSTLTQQLIKNQLLTNEVSFERKAKEILLALRLERFFEKDEILEAYLNIVPFGRDSSGGNIAGIQTAAQGVFGIDASELNIAQAAFLAGLPQSPSAYTPFESSGGLKSEEYLEKGINRMGVVLYRLLEMNYISDEEYEEANSYDIVADFRTEKDSTYEQYPILTEEIHDEAVQILYQVFAEEQDLTEKDLQARPDLHEELLENAKRSLERNGYEIHTTIDKDIYDAFQNVAQNFTDWGPNTTTASHNGESFEQYVQGAGIMIENATGRIISFLPSREYSLEDQINYAKRPRSNGSTMKPILAYGPALEEGVIQPGTPVADIPLTVPSGNGTTEINNINFRHHGVLSARYNLARSYNIPAVRTYLQVMDINPVEKYMRPMGITTLRDNEYANASLALGGTTDGITLEENTNAYSTIANKGQFVDAFVIDKITTQSGDIVFEHEAEPVEVFSPQTSYLLLDMMRDVISSGTAARIPGQLKYPNVDWAGKTGTSQSVHDVLFFASNPNITFGTWMGYEHNDSLPSGEQSRRNLNLWSQLINAASDVRPELVAPSERFERPDGIVERSYCSISGLLPSDLCEQAGLVKTDLFNAKYVPTEVDYSLITGEHVTVDGRAVPAGPNTPSEFTNGNGLMFNPQFLADKGYDKLSNLSLLIPQNEDRSKWEKIAFPGSSSSVGDGADIDNNTPSAPQSLSESNKELTWNAPNNNNIIGYRIYRAADEDAKFSRVGQTSSTSFKIGNDAGIYHVKAVNYYGKESAASGTVIVGDISKDDEDDEPDEEDSAEDEDAEADEANEEKEEEKTEEDKKDEKDEKDKKDKKDEENSDNEDAKDEESDESEE